MTLLPYPNTCSIVKGSSVIGAAWIARVDDQLAGLVELEAEPKGDVGIVVFGLVLT